MAERLWVKQWFSWWTSRSHKKVGSDALLIGLALMSLVRWRKGEDAAWAEFEDGSPMPVSAIAEHAQMSVGRADAALWKLASRGTVACRDDGAWGMPKAGRYQETPEAAKKRKQRGQSRDEEGDIPREAEADAEVDPSLRSGPPPTPPPEGSDRIPPHSVETVAEAEVRSATLMLVPLEPKPATKRRPRLARADVPAGLAEHVFAELVAACRSLTGKANAGPEAITPGMRDDLAKLHAAEQPSAETWSRVIARRLAESRADPLTAKYLTWTHLCRPANFRRYRDAIDGPDTPRNSGRAQAPRGRAEPGPRPTASGTWLRGEWIPDPEEDEHAG